MISRDRASVLFYGLKERLIDSGKFFALSDKLDVLLQSSDFIDTNSVICVYNGINSVPINGLLKNRRNYLKNSFVFPKLIGGSVHFFHIMSPEDLVIDNFGISGINKRCINIDKNDIDVVLISGLAFDSNYNWISGSHNSRLNEIMFEELNGLFIGICLQCQIYKHNLPVSKYRPDMLLTENGFQSRQEK